MSDTSITDDAEKLLGELLDKRRIGLLTQRFAEMSEEQSVCSGCPAWRSGCGWKCAETMANWSLTAAKRETL